MEVDEDNSRPALKASPGDDKMGMTTYSTNASLAPSPKDSDRMSDVQSQGSIAPQGSVSTALSAGTFVQPPVVERVGDTGKEKPSKEKKSVKFTPSAEAGGGSSSSSSSSTNYNSHVVLAPVQKTSTPHPQGGRSSSAVQDSGPTAPTQRVNAVWGDYKHPEFAVAYLELGQNFPPSRPDGKTKGSCDKHPNRWYILENPLDKTIYKQQLGESKGKVPNVADAEIKDKIVLGRNKRFKEELCEPNGLYCDWRPPRSVPMVSGSHLEITRTLDVHGSHWYLTDTSTNGVLMNDKQIAKGAPRPLSSGDSVSFGLETTLPEGGTDYEFVPGSGLQFFFYEVVKEKEIQEKYTFKKEIGKGNFAVVWLGFRNGKEATSQKYAIKEIDKSKFEKFILNRNTTLDLECEEKLLRELHHPNIVQFFEMVPEQEKLYLVTEYCEGGDLLQRVLDYGVFSEATTKRVFNEILEALQYLHDRDIIHRDLKPENILLTNKNEDATAKVADFGLARELEPSRIEEGDQKGKKPSEKDNLKRKLTTAKTFCGTPHYFAPEIIKTQRGELRGYDTKADMWSAGVILYILLSATPPFDDEGLYTQILSSDYSFDEEEWIHVPEEAKDLIRNLMQQDPVKRYDVSQTQGHIWFAAESAKRARLG
ncbi:unnamed protein product [Amoebophrya sp. A120]|nr:unnamed protein product [Amoebophrya sp. A120]|eukprot:GSA120T00008372001.1